MLKKMFALSLVLFLLAARSVYAIDELTVRVPDRYHSCPGYIDKATLVVEPHGGYTEQSLYLEYSDHNQFSQGEKVEIIHRFELPQGAVVNDLWLWIGDQVMKAICIDTWTARSIYDSIVSMKRDPAFLTKKGNQYELHIYPLDPGSFRKIKLNFITPTRWLGNTAAVELPLSMLKANNNTVKPLEVLFRTKENIWGEPAFKESPNHEFIPLPDTTAYHYKRAHFNDIGEFSSLKLTFDIAMENGTYFSSSYSSDSLTYFQSSFQFKDIFNLKPDSSSKKNLIGIDLSGSRNKTYSVLIPNLNKLFKAILKPNDYFNIIVSGAGRTKKLSGNWMPASPINIDNTLNDFMQSTYADSISRVTFSNLIYCDRNSSICWGFTGIEYLANVKKFDNIYLATDAFSNADIVASYDQGFEKVPNSTQLVRIIASLDSFFQKGGRFLTYFDYNRDSFHEPVATHYINGLSTKTSDENSITLFRNVDGNIGKYFPESVDHAGTYTLKYNDPGVKVELRDKFGNPAVISKKIGNGLIVVSGIWSFNDDAPLRKILGVPLLGLNNSRTSSQIGQTLNVIKDNYIIDQFDKALIISNSDSLVLFENAATWALNYAAGFTGSQKPVFNSINLIDGKESVPPYITVNDIDYYGSGFLIKKISENMKGLHFETHLNDWDFISSMLPSFPFPALEQYNIEAYADNRPDKIQGIKEIKLNPQDDNSPRFFIGSAPPAAAIKLNISARFAGTDSLKRRSYFIPVSHDTVPMNSILPSMLGYEKIKEYFAEGGMDTAMVVRVAMKYNLLCDYTALLALEPNDSLDFMDDPDDESGETFVKDEIKTDSLELSIYPNPFNSQTKIMVKVKSPSRLNIYIYNILGQLVRKIADGEEVLTGATYLWDGKDAYNHTVSSGIYLARIELKERYTNKGQIFTRKLLLLK